MTGAGIWLAGGVGATSKDWLLECPLDHLTIKTRAQHLSRVTSTLRGTFKRYIADGCTGEWVSLWHVQYDKQRQHVLGIQRVRHMGSVAGGTRLVFGNNVAMRHRQQYTEYTSRYNSTAHDMASIWYSVEHVGTRVTVMVFVANMTYTWMVQEGVCGL